MRLKRPLGTLFRGESFWHIQRELVGSKASVITVGDITTLNYIQRVGREPNLAVVDCRTRRVELKETLDLLARRFDTTIKITNPPGTIALEAYRAVMLKALEGMARRRVLLAVDGEEDLVVLALLYIMPRQMRRNTVIVYGQPDEGVVLVTADALSMLLATGTFVCSKLALHTEYLTKST